MLKLGVSRVSTQNQKNNGNSLIEQSIQLKQYDSNMPILEFCQSGYNKSIFSKIIPLLKPNMEIVVVYADRISRNLEHFTKFVSEHLEPINAYVYAISENLRTNTKSGKLEFYKKIMDGQTLSHNLGIRVKDGLKHRKTPMINIRKKYGENEYQKKNVNVIMELYNNKQKTVKMLEFLKENNMKYNEIDIDCNSWSINKIKYIIKLNKNKEEYKHCFDFNNLKNEINNIISKKRKDNNKTSDTNKKSKINNAPEEEIESEESEDNSIIDDNDCYIDMDMDINMD
jgi:hypothetical protein